MNVDDVNRQGGRPHSNEQQQQHEKKCRGNRRDQRFRRKSRAQGMRPGKIEKLIKIRNQSHPTTTSTRNTTMDHPQPNVSHNVSGQQNNPSRQMPTTMGAAATTNSPNKRKRDATLPGESITTSSVPKSASSISLRQPSSKKMKKKKRQVSTIPLKSLPRNIVNKNYRFVFVWWKMLNYDIVFVLDDRCIWNEQHLCFFKYWRENVTTPSRKRTNRDLYMCDFTFWTNSIVST